jgi:TctA family transporter
MSIFFTRPITVVLLVLAILSLVWQPVRDLMKRRREAKAA